MRFDQEFEIPLNHADAPLHDYAVMLQVQFAGRWATLRLIDNHLDQHHMHRYDGLDKQQPGTHFAVGPARSVLPDAIRYLVETADPIIDSWKRQS